MEKQVTSSNILQAFWERMELSHNAYAVTITDKVKNLSHRFAIKEEQYSLINEIAAKFELKDVSDLTDPVPHYANESRTVTMDVDYLQLWTR